MRLILTIILFIPLFSFAQCQLPEIFPLQFGQSKADALGEINVNRGKWQIEKYSPFEAVINYDNRWDVKAKIPYRKDTVISIDQLAFTRSIDCITEKASYDLYFAGEKLFHQNAVFHYGKNAEQAKKDYQKLIFFFYRKYKHGYDHQLTNEKFNKVGEGVTFGNLTLEENAAYQAKNHKPSGDKVTVDYRFVNDEYRIEIDGFNYDKSILDSRGY